MYEHTLTVTFDPPFWIALFEWKYTGVYSVAREVIGTSEPTCAELNVFLNRLDYARLRYTIPCKEENCNKKVQRVNFKKLQKRIKEQTSQTEFKHTYSKAHEELKKQQEERKKEVKHMSKIQKEDDMQRKFELRQVKRKEKLRGH